jgi:hypothetical protein
VSAALALGFEAIGLQPGWSRMPVVGPPLRPHEPHEVSLVIVWAFPIDSRDEIECFDGWSAC